MVRQGHSRAGMLLRLREPVIRRGLGFRENVADLSRFWHGHSARLAVEEAEHQNVINKQKKAKRAEFREKRSERREKLGDSGF